MFLITGTQDLVCPVCQGQLKPYDRRKRSSINNKSIKEYCLIRRLRCLCCKRLHAELPDYLIPYKRYQMPVIIVAATQKHVDTPQDDRSISKIKKWYKNIKRILLSIWYASLSKRFVSPSIEPNFKILVINAVNSGFWPTTRSGII